VESFEFIEFIGFIGFIEFIGFVGFVESFEFIEFLGLLRRYLIKPEIRRATSSDLVKRGHRLLLIIF
jgi:hypothetical protein